MPDPEHPLRQLPAPENMRSRCDGCRQPIVWAVTVAGPNGPGGKLMPLDPLEDLAGNVAVTQPAARGRLLARALFKDEKVERPSEYAGMPHFATCSTNSRPTLPPSIAELTRPKQRRRRSRHRRGRRR